MHSESGPGLPLPVAAIGFRPEFLDFRRGIRVGNLEETERITRILKLALEARYQQPFVTERWGSRSLLAVDWLPAAGQPHGQADFWTRQLRLLEVVPNRGHGREALQVRPAGRARLSEGAPRASIAIASCAQTGTGTGLSRP